MSKSVFYLLILFVFLVFTSKGIAQSFTVESKGLYSNEVLKTHQFKFKQNELKENVVFVFNSFNTSNNSLCDFSHQKYSWSINDFRDSESNFFTKKYLLKNESLNNSFQNLNNLGVKTSFLNSDWYNSNRRNIYSGLWAYASLNYLYADLIQFMDKDEHLQYHTGTVNGFEMTPGFIAGSAAFMQIAIANVFLPQIIKNDRTLRWVQIASGTIMTLVQSATLFAGEPTPYYAVLSGFEIAATAFITFDAIKWKPKRTSGKN